MPKRKTSRSHVVHISDSTANGSQASAFDEKTTKSL
jgi:hypothetical protein